MNDPGEAILCAAIALVAIAQTLHVTRDYGRGSCSIPWTSIGTAHRDESPRLYWTCMFFNAAITVALYGLLIAKAVLP
jgi:hypothetical protein